MFGEIDLMPEIQRLISHDISQRDKIGRGRFDITLAERGVFVQGKPLCLSRTRVTKNHQKYPVQFLRRCEIPWAVVSLALSFQTWRLST